jgi:glutamate-5-semialdehyde dehydrogenase
MKKDIAQAKEKWGFSSAMIDRLLLTSDRIQEISDGVFEGCPIWKIQSGQVIREIHRPNGLLIKTKFAFRLVRLELFMKLDLM